MLLDVDELKLRLRRLRIVPDRFCNLTDIIFSMLFLRNIQFLIAKIHKYSTLPFPELWSKIIKLFQLIYSDPEWSRFIVNTLFIRPSEQQVKPGRGALGSQRWDLQTRESWSKIKLKKCVQSFYNDWGDCKRTEVAGIPTVMKRVQFSVYSREGKMKINT